MAPIKMLWGPAAMPLATFSTGSIGTYALDDADDAGAGVLCLPKDGTITHVGVYIPTVTGTPPDYNVGLTTLDSSGNPTQTAYGGGTNATAGTWSTGWRWIALGANATAAAGDFAAVHVWPTGTAPSTSNRIYTCNDGVATSGYTGTYSTAWTLGKGLSTFAVKYSDGTVAGVALSTNAIAVSITSATTPDEIGCKFTLPAAMTVNGGRFASGSWGSAATFDFIIYDESNNVIAVTSVADKDYVDPGDYADVFWDAVSLSANTTYRVVVKPTTASSGNIYMQRYQFESAAALAAWPHGDGSWQYTSRADAGAWTDVSTDLAYIGLWVSNIDFSGGTVTSIFTGTPYSAEFPASNYPQLTLSNRRPVLAFDASTDETAYWTFIVPQGGVGTSLTCVITYAMASATSGAVYWQAQLEAITPGDATDTDAATSFDSANSGNGTVPGTAGYVGTVTITMTNADNIAAADLVRLSVNRDADNASDTATGDAYLLAVELRSA